MMSMLLAAFLSVAQAGTLAGVTLPDTAASGSGETLVLNGMGLREKFFLDIYVGGLYLKAKTHDASSVINTNEPKRIVMKFIYSKVTKQQMIDTFEENFVKNPAASALGDRKQQLYSAMQDVLKGDEVMIDYIPGTGTTIYINNQIKATIPGADFMRALFTIYLGPSPAYGPLKDGMLGK